MAAQLLPAGERPTIPEWLSGKDILVTGATGFMGKVLVEKLLRCCPRLNRLYLVIRPKKGVGSNDRLKDYAKNPLFGPLIEASPDAFEKVMAIPGDISEVKCGFSDEHIQLLKDNVSIVFHTAASVRFDDSTTAALKLNTRGTYELIQIAKEMKKLEVFEYVSTTYCNAHLNDTIKEEVYPSHMDWKILLKLLERGEDDVLDLLVYKLLWTQPNTYTLTKSLAENIVLEANREIPAVIVRPAVVIPILDEPVQGWTDNLNGVMGVTVGVSKGVLRTMKCMPNTGLDYIPVDRAINGFIGGAYARRFYDDGELQVYNETYGDRILVSYKEIVQHGIDVNKECPMENYIWYPFMVLTDNTFFYHFLFFFLQLIPALILDAVLTIAGKKRLLLKLNIKIYNAVIALSDFTRRPFEFRNDKFLKAHDMMTPEDQVKFCIDDKLRQIDVLQFMILFQKGLKKYIFNEKDEDIQNCKKIHNRLYYIDRVTRIGLVGLLIWKMQQWIIGFATAIYS